MKIFGQRLSLAADLEVKQMFRWQYWACLVSMTAFGATAQAGVINYTITVTIDSVNEHAPADVLFAPGEYLGDSGNYSLPHSYVGTFDADDTASGPITNMTLHPEFFLLNEYLNIFNPLTLELSYVASAVVSTLFLERKVVAVGPVATANLSGDPVPSDFAGQFSTLPEYDPLVIVGSPAFRNEDWVGHVEIVPTAVLVDEPIFFSGTGSYYELISTEIDWLAAREDAEQLEYQGRLGRLATIASPEENAFLQDAFVFNSAWIGGFQRLGSSEPASGFRWITDEPLGYTNWGPGEPNNNSGDPNNSNERYIEFQGSGFWNDVAGPPATRGGYLVEYVPNASAVPEPGSMTLIGIGVLAISARILRRRIAHRE